MNITSTKAQDTLCCRFIWLHNNTGQPRREVSNDEFEVLSLWANKSSQVKKSKQLSLQSLILISSSLSQL